MPQPSFAADDFLGFSWAGVAASSSTPATTATATAAVTAAIATASMPSSGDGNSTAEATEKKMGATARL
ncbi:hypothetical protein MN608_06788 [Microdochium nivale]|nr:hypothetical protein MN608_06788 [Microdochium nivale]